MRIMPRKITSARILFVLAAFWLAAPLFAQTQKPITKRGLVEALRLKGLTEQELMQRIETRGVDFRLNEEISTELKQVGAGAQLIETVRAHYRPTQGVGEAETVGSRDVVVPGGPPLSKEEIVTLLETGVPSDRVEKLVEVRGVGFEPSARIAAEITAAGGSRSLVGAVSQKGADVRARAVATTPVPAVKPSEDLPLPKSGSRVFIAPMEGNLHGFLSSEILKKKIPLVMVTDEKDADFIMTGASLAADNKWYNTVFGGRDKNEGNVQLVSVREKRVVWAGEAGDRSLLFGTLRRGGQRKVADRIASKMKKELFE